MIVEYTRNFDRNYSKLLPERQKETDEVIAFFLEYYASQQFPKSLRVHKCNRFLSLSVTMNYRVFVLPINGGVKFVFVGNHQDAARYLKGAR